MPAEITVEPDPVPRLRVRGELDGSTTDDVLAAYARCPPGGADEVVLDLTEVGYLDSSGLAAVVQLLTRVRADGRRLRVTGLTAHFREIFAITRLDEHLTVDGDTPVAAEPRSQS